MRSLQSLKTANPAAMRSGQNPRTAYAGASIGFGKNPLLSQDRRGTVVHGGARVRNQSGTVLLRSQKVNRLVQGNAFSASTHNLMLPNTTSNR